MKVILAHDASAENAAVAPKEKTIVFGLLKRGDKVYIEIVPLYKRLSRVRRTLIALFIQMDGEGIMGL